MRIQCPNCNAEYVVPERMLEGRKTVRCARCTESWVPVALDDPLIPPPAEPPAAPKPAPIAIPDGLDTGRESEASLAPRSRLHLPDLASPALALPVAWVASLTVVAALLILLFVDHAAIADAWPAMARLYGLFGLG